METNRRLIVELMGSFRVVKVVVRPGVGGDGCCMIRRLQILFGFKGRQLGKLLTTVRKKMETFRTGE